MHDTDIQIHAASYRASFNGTLAFARLALAGLIFAGVAGWIGTGSSDCRVAALLAILAAGASYVAQLAYTSDSRGVGLAMQLVALASSCGAFLYLCWAA